MTQKQKDTGKKRGATRSTDVHQNVLNAMETIAREMESNEGIYPQNGGGLSMNEVARRAGIHSTTLQTKNHKELGKQVKAWVESLKKTKIVGRTRVRRSHAERAEDWKAKYKALETTHIITELDLQQAQAERDEALKALAALQEDHKALVAHIAEKYPAEVIFLETHKRSSSKKR